VETLGGVATSLIARNTPIPVKHTETFTTAADMQSAVTIHVYQGERPMASDNATLGEFNLEGIPPAPRGIPKIDVTFDIDANGILNVNAKDQATGKSQSITITGSTRLKEEEKDRMVKEAEKFAEQDKKRREEADALNEADAVCYQGEKMLADFSDKMTDEMRSRIEKGIRETHEALTSKDTTLAKERAEALTKVLKEAGVSIYSQTPGAENVYKEHKADFDEPSAGARPSGSGSRGRVVDADYEETS
jgi:molecular chaperone DnaK